MNMFPTRILAVCALTALVASLATTAAADEPLYEMKPSVKTDADGNGNANLEILARQGYKWNKEFPSKLVIDSVKGAALAKMKFVKTDVKVSGDGKAATFALGGTGKVGPGAVIEGKASFSLCTKKVCKVFMNRKVTFEAGP